MTSRFIKFIISFCQFEKSLYFCKSYPPWVENTKARPPKVGLFFCTMEKQRVIVYVDGFNFYYGLRSRRQWKRYYWIDIVKLFTQFLKPNQELVCVRYFSARPTNIDKSRNQNAFFKRMPKILSLSLSWANTFARKSHALSVETLSTPLRKRNRMFALQHR